MRERMQKLRSVYRERRRKGEKREEENEEARPRPTTME